MNPEDSGLPQPPEGVLDPKIPWSRINPNSRLWLILKARLTGRPQDGYNYSSYVNITEAEADTLIANMKKDPRGYPSLDQESGTPVQWMERQRLYQEWLVEAYLEDPFRKRVDQKIEDAEIDRLVNTRRENKVKPQTPLVPKQEEVKPVELPPVPPEPKVELTPQLPATPAPPPPPAPEPEKKKPFTLDGVDLTPPRQMPSNVSRAMAKYGAALDSIGNQLSRQNSILTRNLGYLRRIEQGLDDTKFLLQQMGENYQEALDDFETEERRKEFRKKIVLRLTSPFRKKKEDKPTSSRPKQSPPKKLSQGGFLNSGYPVAFSSGGATYPSTPLPGLAAGGINLGNKGSNKIIQPGVYTNPVRGFLPPGSIVIPRNRNFGKEALNLYETQKYQQAHGEALQKSVSALLGAGVSVYGSVLRSLGPLAGYFNASIPKIIPTVSSILGISTRAVIDMFGGPAYAGTMPNDRDMKTFYKSWKAYMDKNGLYFPGGVNAPGDRNPQGAGEGMDSGGPEVEWAGGLQYAPPSNPFADTDGQETGVDISLKGKGSNGYGQGLTIRNPWDNLYYFAKVPKGFQNPGSPTRGIQGTSQRVAKGRGPSGFGHWATYYIKDSDGTFYELMIGHLDRPAPTWNDTGSGVKLNKGVKIGIQGASGSSSGNTPDGTYDHMTTHINSPGRRNPGRSGQLLLQWARDLDAFKPSNMPQQPQIASRELGGWVSSLLSPLLKPKGLSFSGVRAGFTAMGREGFNAIMGGANYRNPNKPSLFGKGSRPILGHGAYNAPTTKGAMRYYKPGGGVIKTIVPRGAVGNILVDIIEPQSRVNPETFDKGKQLADKLLRGQYGNSKLANTLRTQLITGRSVQTMTQFSGLGRGAALMSLGSGLARLGGRFLGILNLPVIGDAILPEGTSSFDQISGPNAYYNAPGYRGPKPVTTIQMPSASPTPATSSVSSKPQFVNLDIPTSTVMSSTQMRRM